MNLKHIANKSKKKKQYREDSLYFWSSRADPRDASLKEEERHSIGKNKE